MRFSFAARNLQMRSWAAKEGVSGDKFAFARLGQFVDLEAVHVMPAVDAANKDHGQVDEVGLLDAKVIL